MTAKGLFSMAKVMALAVAAGMAAGAAEPDAAEKAAEAIVQETWEMEEAAETPGMTAEETEPDAAEKAAESRCIDLSEGDAYLLAKIAMAEAEGESVEGKALVMLVVLNRAQSGSFPGTVYGVIFQPGQFSSAEEGGRYWTTEPDGECLEALELIRSGWDESFGALYFESSGKSSWHSRNLNLLYVYGKHYFYTDRG